MRPGDLRQGLITFANYPLYKKAEVKFPPPANYVPPKEPVAVAVLENVLNKVIYAGEKYTSVFVNSQYPPSENSSLAPDLTVKYLTDNEEIWSLCFMEAKRPKDRPSFLTEGVEKQALKYCKDYFFRNSSIKAPFVYAGTLVGTRLRLWIVQRKEREDDLRLHPLWGSEDSGSDEDYKDLGDNIQGPEILNAFRAMVDVPPKEWIGASSTAITPTPQSGAYQLPSLYQEKPMLRTNPILPSTDKPPAHFTRVKEFVQAQGTFFSWHTVSGDMENGHSAEWKVVGGNYVNASRCLYADRNTDNLPVPL